MTASDLYEYLERHFKPLLMVVAPPGQSDSAVQQKGLCRDAARDAFYAVHFQSGDNAPLDDTTVWEPQTIGQVSDLLALGRYHLLRALCDQLAIMADVQADMPTVGKKQSQIHAHALLMLADAEAEIASRGYGKSAVNMGRLQLDFLEPIGGVYGSGGLLSPWGE